MLDYLMFQFDMPTQSVLCTVGTVAVLVGTLFSLEDVFVAPALAFFLGFNLSSFHFADRLEEFQHFELLLLSFCDLFLQEFVSFGEEGKFLGGVDGGRHEDGCFRDCRSRRLFLMLRR